MSEPVRTDLPVLLMTWVEACNVLRCTWWQLRELVNERIVVPGPQYGRAPVVLAETVHTAAESGEAQRYPPHQRGLIVPRKLWRAAEAWRNVTATGEDTSSR